jgi:hypothetical protein
MWLKLAAFIFDKKGTARRPEVIAVSLAPGADPHKIFEWKTTRPHTSEGGLSCEAHPIIRLRTSPGDRPYRPTLANLTCAQCLPAWAAWGHSPSGGSTDDSRQSRLHELSWE